MLKSQPIEVRIGGAKCGWICKGGLGTLLLGNSDEKGEMRREMKDGGYYRRRTNGTKGASGGCPADRSTAGSLLSINE